MSTWKDILAGKGASIHLYEGVISQDASSVNDEVLVTVLAFDEEHTWGPAPFTPRVDDTGAPVLPQEGDRCCVGMATTDDPGEPRLWILAYTDA